MSKYTRIPFFQVGEEVPRLLLRLDGIYDESTWFERHEVMPIRPAFDDEI